MTANHSNASTLLVAIDISQYRHEILIGVPGKKRRRNRRSRTPVKTSNGWL